MNGAWGVPAVAGAILLAVGAQHAAAEPAPKPQTRLYYQKTGSSACPEVEVIRAAVADRLGYDPFAEVAPTTILVAVAIDADATRRARISVIDSSGAEFGQRELVSTAPDCSELAKLVALAIGVAIPAAVARDQQARRSAELAAVAAAAWTSLSDSAPKSTTSSVAHDSTVLRVGLGARASVGAVPGVAPGVALGAEARRGANSLGLELLADFSRAVHVGDAQIGASLYRLAVVGCRHGGGFGLCALVAGGASHAEGHGFAADSAATTPYLALGGRVSFEAAVAEGWSIAVHADAESALYGASLRAEGAMPWTWTAPGAALSGSLVLRIRIR